MAKLGCFLSLHAVENGVPSYIHGRELNNLYYFHPSCEWNKSIMRFYYRKIYKWNKYININCWQMCLKPSFSEIIWYLMLGYFIVIFFILKVFNISFRWFLHSMYWCFNDLFFVNLHFVEPYEAGLCIMQVFSCYFMGQNWNGLA